MASSLKSIPLVAGVEINMSPVGAEANAAAARFEKVFGFVWSRLPTTASAALTAFWAAMPATVFLTRKWTGQGGRLAQCAAPGNIFHFYSPVLMRMPDDVLAVCIAHELAHAFFFLSGDPHHCGGLNDRLFDKALQYRLAESLARELCGSWGFSPRLIGQWCLDNGAWLEANVNDS